jgi:MFS transporter, Spinster family, sphingosine-1-phosphate transporter
LDAEYKHVMNIRRQAEWPSAQGLLAIFCALNLIIYADRGAFASNGINSSIRPAFGLSLFQDGLLPAAFMVGLLIAAPLFAEASKQAAPFRLMAAGLSVWTVAVAGCGLSVGFFSILVCRMAVGVGEASFISLAAPFIDDAAPVNRKTSWLAAFFLCIPVGYAVGYIYGGIAASALGWRVAFLVLAACMLPFVGFCLLAPPVQLRGAAGHVSDSRGGDDDNQVHAVSDSNRRGISKKIQNTLAAAGKDIAMLSRCIVYVWVVAGSTAYTAGMGTYAFWGPTAGKETFGVAPQTADVAFGAITVLTGALGTIAGGVLMDHIGSSMKNGLLLSALGLGVGALLAMLAFLFASSFTQFCVAFAAAEFAMFMTQAPSNALVLWSVPPGLRPLAMSMCVVSIHVLGDVPAPPIAGLLQGRLDNWRYTMATIALLIGLGGIAYGCGIRSASNAIDYRELDAESEENCGDDEGGRGGGGHYATTDGDDGGVIDSVEGRRSSGTEADPLMATKR